MVGNPDISRKSLTRGAKLIVQEEACGERHERLLSLEREGQMFRCTSSDAAATWGQALIKLLDEHRKFAINSAVHTLPLSIYGVRGMMMSALSVATAKP